MSENSAERLERATLVGDPFAAFTEAEKYYGPMAHALSDEERVIHLERRARLLHRVVDALGDESVRWIAQNVDERADQVRRWVGSAASE